MSRVVAEDQIQSINYEEPPIRDRNGGSFRHNQSSALGINESSIRDRNEGSFGNNQSININQTEDKRPNVHQIYRHTGPDGSYQGNIQEKLTVDNIGSHLNSGTDKKTQDEEEDKTQENKAQENNLETESGSGDLACDPEAGWKPFPVW